jgi:hypothetical protein
MIAEQLRAGNLVQTNYGILEVININSEGFDYIDARKPTYKGISRHSLDSVEPIPLIEEWLLKFGFEKTPFEHYKLGGFYIDLHSNTYRLNREWVNIKFQYIHSFQNLYFALTNQELNIKEL